jgi:hypothetical protein
MADHRLERLLSDEFQATLGGLSTPSAIRRLLARTPEVHELQQALQEEAITEDAIESFVAALLKDLRPGSRFAHDLVLAAIAVALENRQTAFADRYLQDLANLRLAEMSSSIRVADEVIQHRKALPTNHASHHALSPGATE